MLDRVFFCPGCRQAHPDHRRPARGELFDCPHCHLLFIPADKDFVGGVAPRDYETEWADKGLGRAPRPPSGIRHRLRWVRPVDFLIIWLSGLAMLGIAGIIWLMAHSEFAVTRGLPPIGRTPPPAAVTADSPAHPQVADPPPAKSALQAMQLDEPALMGEWECAELPLEGVAAGELFALTFQPRGAATIHSRSGVTVESTTARWRLSGGSLTLQFAESDRPRELGIAIEFLDADRMRLTIAGQKPVEFKRKE